MEQLTLHFRLNRVPVSVEPWFWLTTVLLAGGIQGPFLAVWVLVVFVSVLAHEMGHALASRRFGATPRIRLYSLGGLAYRDRPLPRWRSVAVSLAGPGAGFLLGGIIWAVHRALPPLTPGLEFLFSALEQANLGWGLVNLAPVLPLDGGHVMEQVLRIRDTPKALKISAAAGGTLAVIALAYGSFSLAILFGVLAAFNVQRLRTNT
jgi:stage IV sporulation protein FB